VEQDDMKFAMREINLKAKSLPRVVNWTANWNRSVSKDHKSNLHHFRDPSTYKGVPPPSAFLLAFASFCFFDVGMMYPEYFNKDTFFCVKCDLLSGKCGGGIIKRISWADGVKVIHSLDPAMPTLVRVVKYMHMECPAAIDEKNNKRNATFTGFHHKLWDWYPPVIKQIYPFLLRKYPLRKSVARKIARYVIPYAFTY
jgi:hypothetical protein